jgi:hypothetical protein
MLTADELAGLSLDGLIEAARTGRATPDQCADEVMFRPILSVDAMTRRIVSHTASRLSMRQVLVAYFVQQAEGGR